MAQVFCFSCRHPEHPLCRCLELLGSDGGAMPEPVYCECTPGGAMENEIQRLNAENQKLERALLSLATRIDFAANGRHGDPTSPVGIVIPDWELIVTARQAEEPIEALLTVLGLDND